MNSLVTRGSLFDDFFKDFAPGFYVRPLHGDGLPAPSQIKVDVKETEGGFTVQAEVPGVPSEVLTPRDAWADADAYDHTARKLAERLHAPRLREPRLRLLARRDLRLHAGL